jgi:hypothetical protein
MCAYADLWKDFPNDRICKSADLIPLFIDKPMMYPRGEKLQYNNTRYIVLGLVIEKITKSFSTKNGRIVPQMPFMLKSPVAFAL